MSRDLESCESKEGVESGQAQIAAARADASMLFQIVQKRRDQRRIDLLKVQLGRCLMYALLGELQELAKGVTIRTDGVGARLALLHQALGKETLQQGREAQGGIHGLPSFQRCSSRCIASRINSGQALRYQNVSLT